MTEALSEQQRERNEQRLGELPNDPPDHAKHVGTEDVLDLYCYAVRQGWRHRGDRTPYENLRALFDAAERYQFTRGTAESFAFAFICGYGPDSAPGAVASLIDDHDFSLTEVNND